MSTTSGSVAPPKRTWIAVTLAAVACLAGVAALAVEARISFRNSFAKGVGVAEAMFLYLRYFTITTNIALAVQHGTTAVLLTRRRRLLPGGLYDAMLVYATVTGITYELLLRATWSPLGEEFVSDMVLHDVVPLLTLAIWLLKGPRSGIRWRDPLLMLIYPAVYLAITLVAGAVGEGYPYDFLSVAKIGLVRVLWISFAFLLVFLALGVFVTACSSRLGAKLRTKHAPA